MGRQNLRKKSKAIRVFFCTSESFSSLCTIPPGPLHIQNTVVFLQCCPLFYDPSYVPLPLTANITLHLALGGGTKPYPRKISGTSGYANKQVYSPKSRDDSQDDQISTADTEEETKVASM